MLTRIGVIGAGQMGAGIAQVIAASGFSTTLFDANSDALARGIEGIHKRLDQAVEKGKLDTSSRDATKRNLKAASSLQDFADCDLVIEAIIENFETKASLFKQLDAIVKRDGLLAVSYTHLTLPTILLV